MMIVREIRKKREIPAITMKALSTCPTKLDASIPVAEYIA
jgi:hypothetical protein